MQTLDTNRDQGIQDDTERFSFVLWLLFVLMSSLIGDTVILIATCKYKAMSLPNIIVAIIQHMAVCDLLQSIFRVFPVLAAILADGLVLGKIMGHIQTNLMYITTWYTMLLTCALTTVKFAHLKYPFQARAWSKNTGHIIY